MKFLKYTLFTILGIIALLLIVALFVPKTFHAEGTTVINKPNAEVFNYVKHVKNQENFGVWFKMDPNIKVTEEGTDGTVGYKYKWTSDEVGNGSQVITGIEENQRITIDLFLMDGTEPAKSYFKTEAVADNQTKVSWVVDGKTPYPFNLISLCYNMNKDFEQGVQNLKEVLEAQESPYAFALDYYDETFNTLKKSVSGLTNEQLYFKPSKEAWSISQCLEHIILTENMIFKMVKENMEKPLNPERRQEIKFSDSEIIAMATDRSTKYKAPEMLITKGKYDDPETAMNDLKVQREDIYSFIKNTSIDDLRNRVNDSPAGATDAYQSLLFLAAHTARHTLQIEEIKTNTDFPK